MHSSNLASKHYTEQNSENNLIFPGLIVSKEFSFRTLHEAGELAILISEYCPFPKRIELGLNEIFINAIEHGNLDIHYNGGSELYGQEVRFHRIEKMLKEPEHKTKCIKVHLQKNPTYIMVTVLDEGKGFDYSKFMNESVKKSTLQCGRGIYLAKFFSFDSLEYAGSGNIAKCYIHL
jgi:hypothetical protein